VSCAASRTSMTVRGPRWFDASETASAGHESEGNDDDHRGRNRARG
jgi:hypothetical protein